MSQRALLALAGALALLALGLPWGPTITYGDASFAVTGAEHAMRVTGAAGALLVFAGVRRSRRSLVVTGLAVAALALPIGLTGGSGSGRAVYGLAIAVAGLTLLRRPAASTSP